jgi:hypothetical protein
MKKFTKIAAQGDMMIMRIETLPSGLEEYKPEGNHYVIAHSETGHNHVMEKTAVKAYKRQNVTEANIFELFLDVGEESKIEHLRSFDTHETIVVPPGQYIVKRQREYTPQGFRRAQD